MDVTTQQVLLGSAGAGGTDYWITTFSYSPQQAIAGNLGQQLFRVDSASNVYICAESSGPILTKMSDKGVIAWSSKQTSNSPNWSIYSPFNALTLCSDGSLVISGWLIDHVNNRKAGLLRFSSTGTLLAQKSLYGGVLADYLQQTPQLPDGNFITAGNGGYGAAVIVSSTLSSVVSTRNNYKPSSLSNTCVINLRSGGTYQPFKVYQNKAYLVDSVIVDGHNAIGLINLGTNGVATGTGYYYTQPGYSTSNFISCFRYAVTSTGAYLLYNSAQFNTSNYFHLSYTNFSTGVQFSKLLYGYFPTSYSEVEVDAEGNAYVVWVSSDTVVNIFKYDTTGAVVWKRRFSRTGGSSLVPIGGVQVTAKALYIYMRDTLVKLPLDGTLTGTYGQYVYEVSTDSHGDGLTLSQSTGSSSSSVTTNQSIADANTLSVASTATPTMQIIS